MPEGEWRFNEEVVSVFPDMLSRSIPNYQWMRESTSRILASSLENSQLDILEIGCSDGQAYQSMLDFGIDISTYIGFDASQPMIDSARSKFFSDDRAQFEHFDFRNWMPNFSGQFDAVLSILTMQFIPVEHRFRILSEIYENLRDNGVFIFVEKTLGDSYNGHKNNVDAYHTMKHDNGYSYEAIEAKRMSLENVLQPISARENEQMLRDVGFTPQRYWQAFNFCGWAAYKTATRR